MRTRKGEIAMRRSILVILLVFLIPFGAYAHEGMIALVADPAMLDCDDGIEPGTLVNLYLYYMRGDGPYNFGCAQFKLLCSTDEVFVIDPDWVPDALPLGDVTEGIMVCTTGDGYCDADQIYFGTIPIFNFSDNDTFTVSVTDPVFNGYPDDIKIVMCDEYRTTVVVAGNTYIFNGNCEREDDSPIVLGADSTDPRTVTISFNEEIVAASAGETSRYLLIKSGEPDVPIELNSAELMGDGCTVELLLAEDLVELGNYSIFVDGVTDIDGNPVVPGEPYSYALFTAPQVATLLQGFSASPEGHTISVRWKLSEYDDGDLFLVTRSGTMTNGSLELGGIDISREGLSFGFIDADIKAGEDYIYRIDIVTEGGRKTLFVTGAIGVPASPAALYQNTPNPFNPVTTIRYYIPEAGDVRITVFDVAGRAVKRLVRGIHKGGEHSVDWNGSTDGGVQVATGVYFYVFEYKKEFITRKMVLLK